VGGMSRTSTRLNDIGSGLPDLAVHDTRSRARPTSWPSVTYVEQRNGGVNHLITVSAKAPGVSVLEGRTS